MGLNLEYPPGATPLDPDDAAGLIPSHITTQGQLNEWEFQNVARVRHGPFRESACRAVLFAPLDIYTVMPYSLPAWGPATVSSR
jgi:hypothetical protein